MSRIHVSHAKFAVFTVSCAVACCAGSYLAVRGGTPSLAYARTEKPLVTSVPEDGELFIGPNKHTLASMREDGLGASVVVYDAQGHPISDCGSRDARRPARGVSSGVPIQRAPPVDRSFR